MKGFYKLSNKNLELYKKWLSKDSQIYHAALSAPDSKISVISELSTFVLGPAAFEFTFWIILNAFKNKINRLYFLSRDGYFMYKIAKIICGKFNMSIDCRYLSCSRYSLRVPMFHTSNIDAINYIFRDRGSITLEKILKRAGITTYQYEDIEKKLGLNLKINETIPYRYLKDIKNVLSKNKLFLDAMNRNSKILFLNLLGYLKQEGLDENINMAIVDSGWTGSIQKSFNKILEYAGIENKLTGYYWGLYEIPSDMDEEEYNCYYFSPKHGIKEKVNFDNNLFEAIFTAPHGMTLGYKQEGAKYVPCYGRIDSGRKQFILEIEKYITDYAKNSVTLLEKENLKKFNFIKRKEIIKKLMKQFMVYPDKSEADVFGRLLFSDDVIEGYESEIAPVICRKSIRENGLFNRLINILRGKNDKDMVKSLWYEGSLVRSDIKNRNLYLLQYKLYKYLRYIKKMCLARWRNGRNG